MLMHSLFGIGQIVQRILYTIVMNYFGDYPIKIQASRKSRAEEEEALRVKWSEN